MIGGTAAQPGVRAARGGRRWLDRLAAWPAGRRVAGTTVQALATHDRLAALALLLLAALLRMPGIEARGVFDADQGTEMLAMMGLARDGTLPLLGPKVSVGDFHQGALYFIVFTPVAALGGGDPTAVVLVLGLLGLAAVAVTWWLARAIGGWAAGLTAALLLTFSPAAIETSTHMWTPSPMPLFAGLALAAAWRARTSGRARWWAVALASAGVVWQLHHVGVLMLAPVVALLVLEARRLLSAGDRPALRRLVAGAAGGTLAIGLLFSPLLLHELQTGFAETQRIAAYVFGGGEPSEHDLPLRIEIIALRALSWPFSGLLTAAPLLALACAAIVLGTAGAALIRGGDRERAAARWLAGTLVLSVAALAVVAPSLSTVVPGLPNDHYHSFLLPVVVVLVALGLTRAYRRAPAIGLGLLVALLVVQAASAPAAVHPTGGWPAARAGGERVVQVADGRTVALVGVPDFKSTAGQAYPIGYAGGTIVELEHAPLVVAACDPLFEQVVGLACGGPAEDALLLEQLGQVPRAIDRFQASTRLWLSIYER